MHKKSVALEMKSFVKHLGCQLKCVKTLNDLMEEPQLPRQQKIPRRLDDEAGVHFVPSTPQEFHRVKYFG